MDKKNTDTDGFWVRWSLCLVSFIINDTGNHNLVSFIINDTGNQNLVSFIINDTGNQNLVSFKELDILLLISSTSMHRDP